LKTPLAYEIPSFLGTVPSQGGVIDLRNPSFEIREYDAVGGHPDRGREAEECCLSPPALGDVAVDALEAYGIPRSIADHARPRFRRHHCPIFADQLNFKHRRHFLARQPVAVAGTSCPGDRPSAEAR